MNLNDLNINEFIAIDVEATGIDVFNDRIIEIAAIRFKNGKVDDTFSELINPNKKIPSFIENLTGISNKDVSDKPRFINLMKYFLLSIIINYRQSFACISFKSVPYSFCVIV